MKPHAAICAHSTLTIKSVDEEQCIIEGVASTPTPDRDGDILDPKGVVFSLPMPFLWPDKDPIGHVVAAKVATDRIHIRAQIAKGVAAIVKDIGKLIKLASCAVCPSA
jgi:hypothetical protein